MTELSFVYWTDRIGLRPLSSFELGGTYEKWFTDEEVNRFNSHFRIPSSPDSVRNFVNGLATDKSQIVMAIYWLQTNEHIGNISLQKIDYFNRSAELAFLIGEKKFWGLGIGLEAGELLLDHGTKYLSLRRYVLGCLSENRGMIRLAEKLGFDREGTLKAALLHYGNYRDVWIYGRNL